MARKLDHEKAIALRMTGKSYNEIAKDLGVWKSSLSYWLKDLCLPKEAIEVLQKRSNGAKDRFAEYNRLKHMRVLAENEEIKELSSNKINSISNYELLLIGAALYWGEGYKNFKNGSPYISFVNSDPNMVKIFLRFTREVLLILEDKLRPSIHIYPNTDKDYAINFWSNTTGIPMEKFHVYTQVSKASQGKKLKNLLPYGTLDLRVTSRRKFFEIMGFIDGLVKQVLN